VYWRTGKDWPQPFGEPIDLRRSEDELRALLDAMPDTPDSSLSAPAVVKETA
jgi:hypothetical protein